MKTSPMATPETVRKSKIVNKKWINERDNMKTKAKHTATPWELITPFPSRSDKDACLIKPIGEAKTAICRLYSEENAAFIVKACNSYDELLEALKAMHKHFITEAIAGIGEEEEHLESLSMKAIAKAEA